MVKYYAAKIIAGDLTIDKVPKLWRNATEKYLADHQ